jgi:hypothetical protein
LATTVEPTDDARIGQIRNEAGGAGEIVMTVSVGSEARLEVYGIGARDAFASKLSDARDGAKFHALTAEPMRNLRGRVLEATPATPVDFIFAEPEGGAVRLRGHTLAQSAGAPGASLAATLTWESLRPLLRSYTVFLHVIDPATNAKVAQTDALPVCGQNLTNQWNPGDLIEDPQRMVLAEDAQPGPYRLYMGLYDVETGARLPVTDAAGQPVGDFIDLAEIAVVE